MDPTKCFNPDGPICEICGTVDCVPDAPVELDDEEDQAYIKEEAFVQEDF